MLSEVPQLNHTFKVESILIFVYLLNLKISKSVMKESLQRSLHLFPLGHCKIISIFQMLSLLCY